MFENLKDFKQKFRLKIVFIPNGSAAGTASNRVCYFTDSFVDRKTSIVIYRKIN